MLHEGREIDARPAWDKLENFKVNPYYLLFIKVVSNSGEGVGTMTVKKM